LKTSSSLPVGFSELNDNLNTRVEERLRQRASELPEPIRSRYEKVVVDFGFMMMAKSFSRKCAIAISWDLNIKDENVLVGICDATVCGGLYILIFDSVMDDRADPDINPIYDLYLAHLFYLQYLKQYNDISGSGIHEHVLNDIVSGETESMIVNYEEEIWHVASPRPFQSEKLLEHRCSHFKGLLSAILSSANRYDLMKPLSKIVDRGSFSYCLLDDIADWQEDLARNRFTYPIQLCFDRKKVDPSNLTKAEQHSFVLRNLQFGELYHELMARICADFEFLHQECEKLGNPLLGNMFATSLEICERLWSTHIRSLDDINTLKA